MSRSCTPEPRRPQGYQGNVPGFLGDASHALRARELYKYYQPPLSPTSTESPYSPPSRDGAMLRAPKLISSADPALTCFTLLTAKLLKCQRSMITLVDREKAYIVAESTQSLSVVTPHTSDPGDQLWLGGGCIASSQGGLCEHTASLVPGNGNDELILEIGDLSKDERYSETQFVNNWPYMKFYAGVALRTKNGVSLGTFCVMDQTPRPYGLSQTDRMTLTKMGDIVMSYFETMKGDRDMKRGRLMEMGLSRFIAEGYLPGEGVNMTQRIDGRLWSEDVLKERAADEQARRRNVEEKRARLQEQTVAELAKNAGHSGHNEVPHGVGIVDAGEPLPEREQDKPVRARPQENRSHKRNKARHDLYLGPDTASKVLACSTDIKRPPSPMAYTQNVVESPISLMNVMRTSATGTVPENSGQGPVNSLFTPKAERSQSDASDTHTFLPGRKSSYELTSTLEPSFRTTFSRAAALIRETVEADVVFLDGDLEGYYGADGHSHGSVRVSTSTDDGLKPAKARSGRRRSGILGYATCAGSSSSPESHENNINQAGSTDLGFDFGALDAEFVKTLIKESPYGQIFTYNSLDTLLKSASNVECHRRESEIEKRLRRFLPGSTSVMFLPLYEHGGSVFSVCFAWTCCITRTFAELESSYLAAFCNSIMAEVTRLNIIGADKAKGDFISSISHELRSPLHGILASADFLAETKLDNFQKSFVETIVSCGRTLLDTINHVLDFQKLNSLELEHKQNASRSDDSDDSEDMVQEACAGILTAPMGGGIGNVIAKTDLSQLAEEVTEGVYLGYEFKGISTPGITESSSEEPGGTSSGGKKFLSSSNGCISVIVDIDYREDGWEFLGPPGALKRILLNLAGNALKYTDKGFVRIRLKATPLPATSASPSNSSKALISLSVSDSGKGISREFLKTRLFTPFSQENSLIAGTGLGMSIIRQIVGMMIGGKIEVKSEVGRGTKVKVQFILKHTPKWAGLQVLQNVDDEIADVRRRTQGKRVGLVGLGPEVRGSAARAGDGERVGQALRHLRGSVERYVTQWFGMSIVKDGDWSRKPDFVIAHEKPPGTDGNGGGTSNGGGEGGGREDGEAAHAPPAWRDVPMIIICSHASRDEPSRLALGNIGTVCFAPKPCGPRKLARALAVCLDTDKSTPADGQGRGRRASLLPIITEGISGAEMSSVLPGPGDVGSPGGVVELPNGEVTLPVPGTPEVRSRAEPAATGLYMGKRPPVPRACSLPPGGSHDGSSRQKKAQLLPSPAFGAPQGSRAAKKTTVLCVEDNVINLALLTTYLKKAGYPYEKATNGLEALKAVEQTEEGFDIIFMDLQMPVMSGIESTREIRRLEMQRASSGKNVKRSIIVALTGLAAASDQREAFAAGIDSFMVKPVRFKELEKWLERV